jgi:PTH2 family peptidyl-tRNA hydrolase
LKSQPERIIEWDNQESTKIVLKISGEATLRELYKSIQEKGIPSKLIQDAGRTQIEAGSYTCCAFGPGLGKEFESFTSHLKLL